MARTRVYVTVDVECAEERSAGGRSLPALDYDARVWGRFRNQRQDLGIGLITPPVGTVLFVGSAISKLSIGAVTRAMKPFFVALFIVLMLVTYIPWLSLWLPRLLGMIQ